MIQSGLAHEHPLAQVLDWFTGLWAQCIYAWWGPIAPRNCCMTCIIFNYLNSFFPPKNKRIKQLLISCLQLSWFPFFLFDTDWMGREVYHGDPKGIETSQKAAYQNGVREGAFGLLINSVRTHFDQQSFSLFHDPYLLVFQWGNISNCILGNCFSSVGTGVCRTNSSLLIRLFLGSALSSSNQCVNG